MRTLVTFESSAFNTTDTREYFINPGCYGDDTCRWLMHRLRHAGVSTDPEPGQEDFGWYFNFTLGEGEHCLVVVFRPGNNEAGAGVWIAWLERKTGFVGALLGGRKRGIPTAAVSAVHRALASPEVSNVRWHDRAEFESGNEERGSQEP